MNLGSSHRAADPGRAANPIPRDQARFGGRARALGATILDPAPELFPIFPEPSPGGRLGAARRCAARCCVHFARKAFRRPVDGATIDRLAALAEREYSREGRTFEAGVAQAMAAVLASPMFLFREEGLEEAPPGRYPLIDEYALASRLSYFLWSSMPDAELIRLAEEHSLRKNLSAQVGTNARRPAVGGVHPALRRAVAASARHRDGPDQCVCRDLPRSAVRSRSGSISGAIARTEP